MSISTAYATVPEAKALLNKTAANKDELIGDVLVACSRFYESRTHQFFNKDDSVVDRIFIGNGSSCLRLYGADNCPGIADTTGMSVKIDSGWDGTYATTLSAGQYECLPLNAALGPERSPFKELSIPYWTTGAYRYWPANTRVKVSAIYGWFAVPAIVKQDVIKLCGLWLDLIPEATGRINELDQVVSMSPMAGSMIKRWQEAHYEPIFA